MRVAENTYCTFVVVLTTVDVVGLVGAVVGDIRIQGGRLNVVRTVKVSSHRLVGVLRLRNVFCAMNALVVDVKIKDLTKCPLFLCTGHAKVFSVDACRCPMATTVVVVLALFIVRVLLTVFVTGSMEGSSLVREVHFDRWRCGFLVFGTSAGRYRGGGKSLVSRVPRYVVGSEGMFEYGV